MATSEGHDRRKAGPSSWRETLLPTARRSTSTVQAIHAKGDVSANFSREIIRLARALAYIVRFILSTIRAAPTAAASLLRRNISIARQRRHTEPALLSQHTEGPLASGSDPPLSSSADHLRVAVLSSFISPSSSSRSSSATEHAPLLHSTHLASLIDAVISNPRPTNPHRLQIDITATSDSETINPSPTHPVVVPTFTIDTPSASSSTTTEESSPSCSTPSSSDSSFVMLRSALKKPSEPNTPRLALASLDGDEPSTGRSSPAPKSVRFNTEGNETHFFEYASWEEHKKGTGTASTIGRWKKNGGMIVWQDGPDRPRRSSSSSLRSQWDAESEEEAYSRTLFGQSLAGRIISSFLLSSRPSLLSSISPSPSLGEGRRYGTSVSWGDEARWRDGMF